MHSLDFLVKALKDMLDNPPEWGINFWNLWKPLSYGDLRIRRKVTSTWKSGINKHSEKIVVYDRLTGKKIFIFHNESPRNILYFLYNHFEKMLDNVKQS